MEIIDIPHPFLSSFVRSTASRSTIRSNPIQYYLALLTLAIVGCRSLPFSLKDAVIFPFDGNHTPPLKTAAYLPCTLLGSST